MSDWNTTPKDERKRVIGSAFGGNDSRIMQWFRELRNGNQSGEARSGPVTGGGEVPDFYAEPMSGQGGRADIVNPFDDNDPSKRPPDRGPAWGEGNTVSSAPPDTMGSVQAPAGGSWLRMEEPLQTRVQRNDPNVREQSVQRLLSQVGYPVQDDGYFGPQSLTALNDFVAQNVSPDIQFKLGDAIPPEILSALYETARMMR